jgi:hypothetical protein
MISNIQNLFNFGFETAEVALRPQTRYRVLWKELEKLRNNEKRSKSDPPKEKVDESNILSYTVSGTFMAEQFHQFCNASNWSMESYSPIKTVTEKRK